MLIKFMKGLLGGDAPPTPATVAPAAPPLGDDAFNKSDPRFQKIAREELAKCQFIRPEAVEAVYLYLLDQNKLFETKTPLSVEEKRTLGINTRLKITQEHTALLTTQGLQSHYPAEIIPNLWRAATFRYRRVLELEKLRRLAMCKTVTLTTIGESDSCEWCNKTNGKKFDINQDLDRLIEVNCKCQPYWKGVLSPDLTGI